MSETRISMCKICPAGFDKLNPCSREDPADANHATALFHSLSGLILAIVASQLVSTIE